MGLLDGILGGGRDQGGGGGPSGMTLALMALLAYRTYQGKGRLADMLGRSGPQGTPSGGSSGPAQGGTGGGLGDILGSVLGGGRSAGTGASGGLGDLLRGGGLGGMLGGAAGGGLLGAGLNEVLSRMQQNGHAQTADSWVGTGENRQITPGELEQALGRDTLQDLAGETGKPYDEVLSELSRGLPATVDKLTPHGRVPTPEEHSGWI